MDTATMKKNDAPAGERPIPKHIRRSIYCLSIDDPQLAEKAYASWADAIVLDIARSPRGDWQQELKSKVPTAIHDAARGAAEVFVRLDSTIASAALDSIVFPGLTGVVLKGVASGAEVAKAGARLDALEERRGLAARSLEIDVEIDSAAGVWNSLEIVRASERFGSMTLNERALSLNLGMPTEPVDAFEPLEYIKSQAITVATSAGGQAQGMSYPLSLTHAEPGEPELAKAVRRARDTGFKGAVCPHVSWIKACNEGFRPSAEETAYYVKVRQVFAEGLKRGMASVPIDGKMIDVPVDVRARLYLDWADRAKKRDEEKAEAHRRNAS